ncbi:patatin-like phospholipase family protein [Roseimarinus sediminis]|uniref:patatin-like phospholipase family protein n=1 Tax=Roseimarinus sediminis TaxID=1610899 RepID=UPI003D1C79B5
MKQKVALVLGSGGARGIAHIGAIRELLDNGYTISSISGTSMGALIGGVYAAGKLDEFEAWLNKLNKKDVFSLMDFTLSKSGILKASRALLEIQKFIPDQQIEDLPINYSAIAADLKQNKEIIITQGSLFEAIRASIAIPMVLTPVKRSGSFMVDGGILNPVPTNRVVRHENDLLVAINVTASIPGVVTENIDQNFIEKLLHFRFSMQNSANNEVNMGYINLIVKTSRTMIAQIAKLTLELSPPDMLVEVSSDACGTFEFYKASELIEIGRNAMSNVLKKNNLLNKKEVENTFDISEISLL